MLKILHNPKCSKSRATLEILKAKGLEPVIVEYLVDPLSKNELLELLEILGLKARAIIRDKGELFESLQLDLNDDEKLIEAIAANPSLMQRPIVIKEKAAVIARPPENVLRLL